MKLSRKSVWEKKDKDINLGKSGMLEQEVRTWWKRGERNRISGRTRIGLCRGSQSFKKENVVRSRKCFEQSKSGRTNLSTWRSLGRLASLNLSCIGRKKKVEKLKNSNWVILKFLFQRNHKGTTCRRDKRLVWEAMWYFGRKNICAPL